jgi:hypothetical protein
MGKRAFVLAVLLPIVILLLARLVLHLARTAG